MYEYTKVKPFRPCLFGTTDLGEQGLVLVGIWSSNVGIRRFLELASFKDHSFERAHSEIVMFMVLQLLGAELE